ncbi:MAG: hypothetical protein FRX49_12431 [Trebouxia sp. A1-2]|nr:MAG: hypothetical protein FRX49_12431 [Trebouxia sp. A1-2]
MHEVSINLLDMPGSIASISAHPQASKLIVATPSCACHISFSHQLPVELVTAKRSLWGKEYPYQSTNSVSDASDAGENFRILPLAHPVLKLHVTLFTASGHSLGGAYANAVFLDLLSNENSLVAPLLHGGVYTFGAPLVLHRNEAGTSAQIVHLAFLRHQKQASGAKGWTKMPVYNFVNGLDIVPRLLGDTQIPAIAKVLSKILPKTWQNLLLHPVNLACTMTPFGSYCLMSGHVVRLVDSATQPQLLQITFDQLFSKVRVISEKANAAQSVWQRFLSDHRLQSYKDGLHTSLSSMIPILFMGGKISDYQPMLLQRQTADGVIEEVGLQHKATNVVSHSAFAEIPLDKVFTGLKVAYGGGRAVADVLQGSGPKDFATVSHAAIRGAGKAMINETPALKDMASHLETAVQQVPGVGKVVAKSVMSNIISSVGPVALGPALGIANFAAGLINLGLAGYNTFQLRGISKLQKVMDAKLDVMSGQLTDVATEVAHVAQNQRSMMGQLDWLVRSQDEVRVVLSAVNEGLGKLHLTMQDQTIMLNGIAQYLEKSHAAVIEGQSIIIAGQKVLLEEVLRLHSSVLDGTNKVWKELRSMSLDGLCVELTTLTRAFIEEQRRPGNQMTSANLEVLANRLQSALLVHLDKISPSCADQVALRQPFIIAYAIAAVAWDLAAPLANSNAGAPAVRVFIDTHHRNEALRMVDEEIVQLLQLISPFSLATTFQDVLMRYVFLRRALQGRVNIDEVLPVAYHAKAPASSVTYAALDLMWLDGLDELRALLPGSVACHEVNASDSTAEAAPQSWICSSKEMLEWYCVWQRLPADAHFTIAPMVSTTDLLCQLGVPQSQMEPVISRLTADIVPALCKMVLPAYWNNAVALMDEQLPGLGLLDKLSNKPLVVRGPIHVKPLRLTKGSVVAAKTKNGSVFTGEGDQDGKLFSQAKDVQPLK